MIVWACNLIIQVFASMDSINLLDTSLSSRWITGTMPDCHKRLYTLSYASVNSGPVLLLHACANIAFES